ncbi:putative S-adenosyl-L-methionine-dependent methyltransferase, partial [Cynara cardunculus var. scolymus]
ITCKHTTHKINNPPFLRGCIKRSSSDHPPDFHYFPSQHRSIMATKGNPGDNRTRRSFSVFIVFGLCCFFYLLGAWQRSGFGKGDSIAHEITKNADCSVISNLNIETHHGVGVKNPDDLRSESKVFQPCDDRFIDYTPCHDQSRAMSFPRENMEHRERHCPSDNEKQHCLIPAPKGYVTPFTWPKSRDYVPFANAPYKSLTVEKATQNWIQYEGNVFRFPGGGTQFPRGVDAYIEQMASVVPIGNGIVRTALDTGCGKNVITMSIAPRDSHEAQVQFALERGVPAIIDVLGTIKLPFPSRSFDMAHCSQCLIPWTQNDGKYMMEVDRVLRPGGYWVLSGPPINWRMNYKAWKRSEEELEEDQRKIEEIAKLLCWEKKHEKGEMAVWRKRVNKHYCQERESRVTMCKQTNVDDIWCDYEDILLEMDRILRPEGTVIIRDHEIEVIKVKKIVSGMMWNTKMVDHEDGPLVPEKILFVVKQYWVAGENNLTSLR